MYVFSVETTAADDATIIAEFNTAPNKSRFNFFYQIARTRPKASSISSCRTRPEISPFDVLESSRDFMSARAADLTLEQHRLRQRQDVIRLALTSTQHNAREWPRLSALNATVFRRLGQIRREKQAEVARREGSRAQWRALDREFRTMVQGRSGGLALREELQQPLERIASIMYVASPRCGINVCSTTTASSNASSRIGSIWPTPLTCANARRQDDRVQAGGGHDRGERQRQEECRE